MSINARESFLAPPSALYASDTQGEGEDEDCELKTMISKFVQVSLLHPRRAAAAHAQGEPIPF